MQMVMPKFPVIVKIGHAHAGMGKVRVYVSNEMLPIQMELASVVTVGVGVREGLRFLKMYGR